MDGDPIYSMDDLAWLFRCPRKDAVQLCQAGSIRSFRVRGCYFVREGAIVEYLMRLHRTKKKSPAYVYGRT